jgi:hypothetical protein
MKTLQQYKSELLANSDKEMNLFVFVHCVADKKLWFEIDTVPSNQYVNLLPKEEQDKLGEITPYIVSLYEDNQFTDWILSSEYLMKDAFFVTSQQNINQFSERFKNLIYCYDDEGKKFYFGFYTADIFSTYMDYLKKYEPSQCKGLLSGVETLYFNKRLLTQERQTSLPDDAVYYSFKAKDYLANIKEEKQMPSSYLAPTFFDYFSQIRVIKYKEKVYQKLIDKYPDRKYSTQDKKETLNVMGEIIESAKEYKITDEEAVEGLFEASWLGIPSI